MSEEDKALFRKLYGDIQRVGHDRHEHEKSLPRPRPRPQEIMEEASPGAGLNPYPEIHNDIQHAPDDYVFRRSGIQNAMMKKLKTGKLPIEGILDLHGMTREMALEALHHYINDCRHHGIKCIQVVHGKGYRSEDGKPVLKPAVAHWLREMKPVLAYCPALPRDGGSGALYVLLKTLR